MKLINKPLLAGVCFSLLAISPTIQLIASEKATYTLAAKAEEKKKITKKSRNRSSRKNHAIKIFPDTWKRIMHVEANNNIPQVIDFFVFDLQGTLIQHYKMEAGERAKLVNLKRGKYVYHVFSGDEETANGQFDVR